MYIQYAACYERKLNYSICVYQIKEYDRFYIKAVLNTLAFNNSKIPDAILIFFFTYLTIENTYFPCKIKLRSFVGKTHLYSQQKLDPHRCMYFLC